MSRDQRDARARDACRFRSERVVRAKASSEQAQVLVWVLMRYEIREALGQMKVKPG